MDTHPLPHALRRPHPRAHLPLTAPGCSVATALPLQPSHCGSLQLHLSSLTARSLPKVLHAHGFERLAVPGILKPLHSACLLLGVAGPNECPTLQVTALLGCHIGPQTTCPNLTPLLQLQATLFQRLESPRPLLSHPLISHQQLCSLLLPSHIAVPDSPQASVSLPVKWR